MADEGDTLEGHLRRVRKERGLKQTEVAALMGVSKTSVLDWENGKQPHVRMYPVLIAFLGYEPWPKPRALAELLLAERRRRGLSAKRAAKLLGVDEGTWAGWECNKQPSRPAHHAAITAFLANKNGD
jgi:transcriptional regulator with XRE-family HTH domain